MKPAPTTFAEKCQRYALWAFHGQKHTFGSADHVTQLNMIHHEYERFKHLAVTSVHPDILEGCVWAHSTISKAKQTYQAVISNTNILVADVAHAMVDEKGKTRSDKNNVDYYAGLREVDGAAFIKIIGRVANVKYAWAANPGMFKIYKEEQAFFTKQLYADTYKEIFDYLNYILSLK